MFLSEQRLVIEPMSRTYKLVFYPIQISRVGLKLAVDKAWNNPEHENWPTIKPGTWNFPEHHGTCNDYLNFERNM